MREHPWARLRGTSRDRGRGCLDSLRERPFLLNGKRLGSGFIGQEQSTAFTYLCIYKLTEQLLHITDKILDNG